MKILLLMLFSDSEIYNQMLEIQRNYIHQNNNIDAYFIAFNEEQTEEIQIIEDIIYVKGKETYTNILYKTLKSLEYIFNIFPIKYDFVVRSNISTIIHLNNLYQHFLFMPKINIYTGGTLETLKWPLQPYEISSEKQCNKNEYYGLKYIQGTSIILSRDVVKRILEEQHNIEYDIVDDVKLGLIIQKYFPKIYENIEKMPMAKVTYNHFQEDSIFIRNRSEERKLDTHRMREISTKFNNVKYPNFDKIIHITHKTIHEKLINVKEQWENLNPEYKVELYDDKRCIEILSKYYGNKFCEIFHFIKDGAIKSDFFRACLLYITGGIYVDSDIKPIIPLKEYVDDDIDFMTCLSYNYATTNNTYEYNPHFIVCKKYSLELWDIIKSYENLYQNHRNEYSYWSWSICKLFKKIYYFQFDSKKENVFILNNKKYKFLIETILDPTIGEEYDFSNFKGKQDILVQKSGLSVYCKYKENIVLYNFENK